MSLYASPYSLAGHDADRGRYSRLRPLWSYLLERVGERVSVRIEPGDGGGGVRTPGLALYPVLPPGGHGRLVTRYPDIGRRC